MLVVPPAPNCDWGNKYEQSYCGSWPVNSTVGVWPHEQYDAPPPLYPIDLQPILDSAATMLDLQFCSQPFWSTRPVSQRFQHNLQSLTNHYFDESPITTTGDTFESLPISHSFENPRSPRYVDFQPPCSGFESTLDACQHESTQEQSTWPKFRGELEPQPSFPDILFSSIVSSPGSNTYDPINVCDLCHKPFETEDDDELTAHLTQHMREFEGTFKCNDCNISFMHKGDLDWHLSCERRSRGFRTENNDAKSYNSNINLINWELAQLDSHYRKIDQVRNFNTSRRSKRSSSLPPRRREVAFESRTPTDAEQHEFRTLSSVPTSSQRSIELGYVTDRSRLSVLADSLQELSTNKHSPVLGSGVPPSHERTSSLEHDAEESHDSLAYGVATQDISTVQASDTAASADETDGYLRRSAYALQRRILGLLERVQPKSPESSDQGTPYSEFCDSHSLPGSPEQLSGDPSLQPGQHIDRARSEPPPRFERLAQTSVRQVDPYHGYGNVGEGGSGRIDGPTKGSAQRKRQLPDHNGAADEDEDDSGQGSQPKKRKVATTSSTGEDKRFPCVCYIGEPQRFSTDVAKHKHISNLCRHLKSHSLYICSTCVLGFPNDEDLDLHIGCHVKACRVKGCKRTRPAFNLESVQCQHILTPDEQWKAIFRLKYNREPPNIFGTAIEGSCNGLTTLRESSVHVDRSFDPSSVSVDFAGAPPDISMFNNSFSKQATHLDLESESAHPITPSFDIDDFLIPSVVEDSGASNMFDSSPLLATESLPTTEASEMQQDPPILKIMSSLQQQVDSLETLLAKQAINERTELTTLQAQVVQLEQKLFQSSARERQLEATLGVVFDALQATGAPQAQQNSALWKLVMSHSSQAISSATGFSEQPGSGQRASSIMEVLSPAPHALSIPLTGKRAVIHPDSAYGSVR